MSTQTIQAGPTPVADSPSFHALGIRVDAVQIPDAIGRLENWIRERTGTRYVAVTGMHGATESLGDTHFRDVLLAADLVVPDGMPLVWLGFFILWLILIIKAYQDQKLVLPVIGPLAEKQAGN